MEEMKYKIEVKDFLSITTSNSEEDAMNYLISYDWDVSEAVNQYLIDKCNSTSTQPSNSPELKPISLKPVIDKQKLPEKFPVKESFFDKMTSACRFVLIL